MQDLRDELTALREVVQRQQDRIAVLEAKATAPRAGGADPAENSPTTRRQLLFAAAAAVGGAAAVAGASPAQASTDDNLVLGHDDNSANQATALDFTGVLPTIGYAFGVTDHWSARSAVPLDATLYGHSGGTFSRVFFAEHTGDYGVGIEVRAEQPHGMAIIGSGGLDGVNGWGHRAGVAGDAFGQDSVGVDGHGYHFGVRGSANANSPYGVGVLAKTFYPAATALAVDGVFRASRAGRNFIAAGARSTTVKLKPLTRASLVFATLQPYTGPLAVSGITTKVAGSTSFTVYLTGNAPAGGIRFAWFVVDLAEDIFTHLPPVPTAGETEAMQVALRNRRKPNK